MIFLLHFLDSPVTCSWMDSLEVESLANWWNLGWECKWPVFASQLAAISKLPCSKALYPLLILLFSNHQCKTDCSAAPWCDSCSENTHSEVVGLQWLLALSMVLTIGGGQVRLRLRVRVCISKYSKILRAENFIESVYFQSNRPLQNWAFG